MRLFCGIDIGLKGGLAIIDESSKIVKLLPLRTLKNQQGKDEIDSCFIYESIDFLTDRTEAVHLTVIEALRSYGNEGRSSLWSFGTSNGKTRAVLEILGLSFMAVNPKDWQSTILRGTKKDKAAAIGFCLQKWPQADLKQGSSQYRDGLSDALCLAEWGRRSIVGDGNSGE